jgi:Xaa-Pro aminopeptidase
MDFARPTILLVPKDNDSTLITPLLDVLLIEEHCPVEKVVTWNDGIDEEWRKVLPKFIKENKKIACEKYKINATVSNYLMVLMNDKLMENITPIINNIRMIKSDEELMIARHAGEVAMAMMEAGKKTLGHNVPEYEVALATSEAGTRKAAEILNTKYNNKTMSPNIHFLQVIASGKDLPKTHHRASTKLIKRGDPVFLCFCGSTNFHRFKLGFDRIFWIEKITDDNQSRAFEVAVKSQQAALNVLGPGVTAEQVHAAYADTVQSEGYPYPTFRCGRATGFSVLEEPQLVVGNKTVLQPGMVFAVDGGASTEDFRAQVGDSFIITKDGYEQITHHSKEIKDLIV